MTSTEQHTLTSIRAQLTELQAHIDAIKAELTTEYQDILTRKGQAHAELTRLTTPDT